MPWFFSLFIHIRLFIKFSGFDYGHFKNELFLKKANFNLYCIIIFKPIQIHAP